MSEDTKPAVISRRDFLKLLGGSAAAIVTSGLPEVNSQHEETLEEMVDEIDTLPLEELQRLVYEEYPIVPEISVMGARLNEITRIPERSVLMLAGTSVAGGMLGSLYAAEIDSSQVNFGHDQNKADIVLSRFTMPDGAQSEAIVSGVDVPQLLHEPMLCDKIGGVACPPNTSVIDAYIDHYKPKVAINFTGTNLIRSETSLLQFAKDHEELINHYVNKGVIPVLTTIPMPSNRTDIEYVEWFENPDIPDEKDLYGKTPEEWKREVCLPPKFGQPVKIQKCRKKQSEEFIQQPLKRLWPLSLSKALIQ